MTRFEIVSIFFLLSCFFLTNTNGLKQPKVCRDCKHLLESGWFSNNEFAKCAKFIKPNHSLDHLVTGKQQQDKIEYYYCSTARSNEDMCGIEGIQFELKGISKKKKREEEDGL